MNDITKLILDGTSVGAVIAIVIIFLKYQITYNKSLKEITDDFAKRIEKMQDNFQHQIDRLANDFLKTEEIRMQQIQNLFESFMNISHESVKAVKELEAAVSALRNEVSKSRKQSP